MPARTGRSFPSRSILAQRHFRDVDTCPAGPYYPTILANVAVGDVAWSNPTNAVASDNIYATSITVAQSTQQLQATGFNFNILSTDQIDGILVECEAKSTLGGDTVLCRIIKGGSVSATSRTNTWENVEAQVSYGGATNLWGETWTPADINAANFGVSIRQESGLTGTLSLDAVRITVYCSVPAVTVTFRKTFSGIGTRTGSRQLIGV